MHFGESKDGKCPLHDNVESRHEQEIKEAAEKAMDKVRAENPNVSEADLKIQISDQLKRAEEARKNRIAQPEHHAGAFAHVRRPVGFMPPLPQEPAMNVREEVIRPGFPGGAPFRGVNPINLGRGFDNLQYVHDLVGPGPVRNDINVAPPWQPPNYPNLGQPANGPNVAQPQNIANLARRPNLQNMGIPANPPNPAIPLNHPNYLPGYAGMEINRLCPNCDERHGRWEPCAWG